MATLLRVSEADLDFEAISIKMARPCGAVRTQWLQGRWYQGGCAWKKRAWVGPGSALLSATWPAPGHPATLSLSSPSCIEDDIVCLLE